MNKLMALYDGLDSRDGVEYTTFNTSIDIKNPETGEYIFKGLKNKVIIPGSGLIARKLFDITSDEITLSYNTAFGSSMHTPATTAAPTIKNPGTDATVDNHKILLFCLGIDGCGDQNSQVYPVDYRKWIDPDNMVPFRFQPVSQDLTDELRDTYFGRTAVTGTTGTETAFYAYYFKRFETAPKFVQQYIDGTPVSSDIYEKNSTMSAETYVELNLKVTKQDCRGFFQERSGIENARINSISLCSAYPVEETVNGKTYIYYKDIRPVTKFHIPNESLIDVSKGIDIVYHIYM